MSDEVIQKSEPKKSSSKPIIVACCLIVFCLVCICCSAFVLLLGSTVTTGYAVYTELDKSVVALCNNSNTEVNSFYQDFTSRSFKANTSLEEFRVFYNTNKNILFDCSKAKSGQLLLSLLNGANVDYSNENNLEVFTLKYNSQNKVVTIQFVKESGGWKVNGIQID